MTTYSLRGRHSLDLPVAGLAAFAAAFAIYAIPADLLSALVDATGISSILPFAEPPLGSKARVAVGLAAAIGLFCLSLLLMRALDRVGTRPDGVREPSNTGLRLRRRDHHPDAPIRAPLLATLELTDPEPLRRRESREEEVPVWLQPAAEPEPAPGPLAAPAFEPSEPSAAPRAEEAPGAKNPLHDFFARLPHEIEMDAAEAAEAILPADPSPAALEELMERLEKGLTSRQSLDQSRAQSRAQSRLQSRPEPRRGEARESPPPAPPTSDRPLDDRLQMAIENLHRLTSR